MREILFKAKRLDNWEWVEGCLLIDYVTGKHFIHASGNSVNDSDKVNEEGCLSFVAFEIDPETICQCVNYAGAWEHDIFRCDDELYSITYSESDLMWEAENLYSSESIQLGEFLEDEIEIVGNLIDNPEIWGGTEE